MSFVGLGTAVTCASVGGVVSAEACESVQKFLLSEQAAPNTSTVPEFAHVLKIYHRDGVLPLLIACTRIPVIYTISSLLSLLTDNVTVIVVSVTEMPPMVTLPGVFAEALQLPALNFRFDGAVRISVTFVCGLAKSVFACSSIVMFPKAVRVGLDPLAAWLIGIFVPLLAGVTVTPELAFIVKAVTGNRLLALAAASVTWILQPL